MASTTDTRETKMSANEKKRLNEWLSKYQNEKHLEKWFREYKYGDQATVDRTMGRIIEKRTGINPYKSEKPSGTVTIGKKTYNNSTEALRGILADRESARKKLDEERIEVLKKKVGSYSIGDLRSRLDSLLKDREKDRERVNDDPEYSGGLSARQVRDKAFGNYVHELQRREGGRMVDVKSASGGAPRPGGAVPGASYDFFGMPVDPGSLSAINMNKLSDRERAQVIMQHNRDKAAYRTAMKTWRQNNPEAARRGMTAREFLMDRFVGSEAYETAKAQARLQNAFEKTRRQEMNELTGRIEAYNDLVARGYTQDTMGGGWKNREGMSAPGDSSPSSTGGSTENPGDMSKKKVSLSPGQLVNLITYFGSLPTSDPSVPDEQTEK